MVVPGEPQVRRAGVQFRAGHATQAEVSSAGGRVARSTQRGVRVRRAKRSRTAASARRQPLRIPNRLEVRNNPTTSRTRPVNGPHTRLCFYI